MSILFVSDIHADKRALDAVLAITGNPRFQRGYGSVEKVICLGDIVDGGDQPKPVVDTLRRLAQNPGMDMVIGNHDEALRLDRDIGRGNAKSRRANWIFKHNREDDFMAGWPTRIVYPELGLVVAHGGPVDFVPRSNAWDDKWICGHTWQRLGHVTGADLYYGYKYTPTQAFATAQALLGRRGNIVVVGHNHHEEAFCGDGELVYDLNTMTERTFKFPGDTVMYGGRAVTNEYIVRARTAEIKPGMDYIFAIGCVWRQEGVGFAVLHGDRTRFTMFNFTM